MAILVFSPNGTHVAKPTLEAARTSADCAGKTVVVTSALTAAQSDITAPWPVDRALEVKKGGSIANTVAFTINGSFIAGLYQVFTGSGALTGLAEARPEWFGAVGDGVADDTPAFSKAVTASKSLHLSNPDKTYLLHGLIISPDVKIWGVSKIKTPAGHVTNLSAVSLDFDEGPMRIMLFAGALMSWEELLTIKSLGYNTILDSRWWIAQDSIVITCAAVGLKTIVNSGYVTVPATITTSPVTNFDGYQNVIGYYLIDEPIVNKVSVADQDRLITAYRAVTKKLIFTCENSIIGERTDLLCKHYDVLLTDVYYGDVETSANATLAHAIRIRFEYRAISSSMKIIPCLGLFSETNFNKAPSVVASVAEVMLKFSHDGSFGVFVWDVGDATTVTPYPGVRNNATYFDCAKRLVMMSKEYVPFRIDAVSVGTLFGSSNTLYQKFKNTVDSATPGVSGTSPIIPWDVYVGSVADSRHQAFAVSGLMISHLGGSIGFSDAPSGICCTYLWYQNHGTGQICTVSLGASTDGGYTSSYVDTRTISNFLNAGYYAQLSTDIRNMPILQVTLATDEGIPYAFIYGYIIFTDILSVSF